MHFTKKQMKQLMKLFLFTLLLSTLTTNLNSQVTIGSKNPPLKGALLDLKEFNVDGDKPDSRKGMAMPRVSLTDLKNLYPMFEDTNNPGAPTAQYSANKNNIDKEHIGLFVFNVGKIETQTKRICPGLHIWNGDTWYPLTAYEATTKTRTLKSATYKGLTFLDPNNPSDPMWATLQKDPTSYPLGYRGIFKDTRNLLDIQNYNHTRFYVGYTTTDSIFSITANYSCDQDPSKAILLADELTSQYTFEDGTWMADNLRALTMPDGTAIGQYSGTLTYDPLFTYPLNTASNRATYGVLYNFQAATNRERAGVTKPQGGLREGPAIQGVCPDGWHLPSDRQWHDLINAITLNTSLFSSTPNLGSSYLINGYNGSSTEAGKPMKSTESINSFPSGGTSLAPNAGGFNGQLIGSDDGSAAGRISYFWTSSPRSEDVGWKWRFADSDTGTSVWSGSAFAPTSLEAIRCIKTK